MNDLSTKEFVKARIDLDELCDEIRERACSGEFDQQAYVSQDIIQKLKQLGCIEPLFPNVLVAMKLARVSFVN